jgi:hypothetical protein
MISKEAVRGKAEAQSALVAAAQGGLAEGAARLSWRSGIGSRCEASIV